MRRLLLTTLVLAGCGSAPTPPPAGPARAVARDARLDGRARTLTVGGRTVPAGVGPVAVAATSTHVYVADRIQSALLIFDRSPLELQRRVYVPGRPVGLSVRGERLLVTLADGGQVARSADGVAKPLRTR